MVDSFFLSGLIAGIVALLVGVLSSVIFSGLSKYADRMRVQTLEHAIAELEALVTREMKRRAARERWEGKETLNAFEEELRAAGEAQPSKKSPWWRKYGSKAE